MCTANQPLVHPSGQRDAVVAAPIMPTAYWVSQGIPEPTAYGMERFQLQLVERKFIYGHVIYIEPPTSNVEAIPHHDLLLPHWRRYLKNLAERGRAKSFFVDRFELHTSVLDVVVPSLMPMHLNELGLCRCRIDREGLLLILKYMSQNSTLKRLLLNENRFEDLDVAEAYALAIKNHPSMEELCISHCMLGVNDHLLREILGGCNRLKVLRLNGNDIGTECIKHIGTFLAGNPNLTTLRLDNNILSDDDAAEITAALQTNTNLKYLYLKGNDFSEAGKKEMTTAVFDTASLNSIAASNHNCEIVYDTPVVTSTLNEKYWSTNRKVRSKIILALYGIGNETDVVQYFRDFPLELIPNVLQLIQREIDLLKQHDASMSAKNEPPHLLGRMFDFIRVWNLPWLFENGGHQAVGDAMDVDG